MTRLFRNASETLAVVKAIATSMMMFSVMQASLPLFALTSEELAVWAAGPVQWLLLPEERKELKRVGKSSEAVSFIETFWVRRDRDSLRSGNEYRNDFVERVDAADVLYGDEGVRGSLTDRGRALILLGPPTHVTVATEPVMAWDPVSEREDRVSMRNVNVEIWGYRMEGLPAGMLDLMLQNKKKAAADTLSLTLMFRTVGHRTSLVEGEVLLEAAARAAVYPLQ